MKSIEDVMSEWNALQPLSDRDREMLSRRFTIDFNYNSNHIEGNTLTYGQTEILLLFGKIVGEADVRDVHEMTASNVGLKMMKEEARLKETPLTQHFIRTLHKTLLREDYTVYSICLEVFRQVTLSIQDNTKPVPILSSHVMVNDLSMLHQKRLLL